MLTTYFVRILTVVLCVFFAGFLPFISSCKKSPSQPPVGNSNTQAAKQTAPEPKPEATKVPAQPATKPAEQTTTAPQADTTTVKTTTPETKTQVIASETKQIPAPAAAVPAAANADLVPIDFNLPKAMFVGTPLNSQMENLEKPLGKPRPPFLAPAGTKNVALNKPVTGSDSWPLVGKLNLITDGDKSAADGHYVELAPFKQYVTMDLGAKYEIYAILVWHYHMQARVYMDVIVQVADDPNFTENLKTLFNNDIKNSSELGAGKDMNYTETNEGKLIDAKGVKARYVRLYSSGNNENDFNHYIEVEVYGKP